MTTCEDLSGFTSGFSLIESCDQTRDGFMRLSTPFRYPDGSQIDLFLGSPSESRAGVDFILSDKGQTTAYLLDLNVRPWTTRKRKQAVDDVCETLDVRLEGGQLTINLTEQQLPDISSMIVRLAQACIRVTDLAFTQRLRAVNSFKEDIEEFFETTGLEYQSPVLLDGRLGAGVEVDFRVIGRSVTSLVQTVSTGNAYATHGIINEVFRRWYELPEAFRIRDQFVTIYDSGQDFYRGEDLAALGEQSVVFAFPAQADQIAGMLAA
jgi:hypothetical protein